MTRLLRECSKEFFRKGIPVQLPEYVTLPVQYPEPAFIGLPVGAKFLYGLYSCKCQKLFNLILFELRDCLIVRRTPDNIRIARRINPFVSDNRNM